MGPNRRAQERERAAATAAEEAKRAEAEPEAIGDAQKIVAIWNARQAGGGASGALPLPSVTPPASSSPSCRLSPYVPSGPQWAYEIKHDGFRFICRRDGDRVRVFSRCGSDYTDRVPLIAEALTKLRLKSVTIDGEGVVCRPDGVSDFDRLRAMVGRMGSREAFLYAFGPPATRRTARAVAFPLEKL
jgi:ATP-dependent DNA ligase